MENAPQQKVFLFYYFYLTISNDLKTLNFIAAAEHGIIYTLSTVATSSIEDIAAAAPSGINWFQLYIYKDR